jgi:hypothetical protein
MDQLSQSVAPKEIRCMSLIQLFHYFVAIASWDWPDSRYRFLNLDRANECDQRLSLQPACAAVSRSSTGDIPHDRPCSGGHRTHACDEAR